MAHSRRADIIQHLKSAKHKEADIAASSSSSQITSFFTEKAFDSSQRDLAAKEGTFAYHTVMHNDSFQSTDCTSKLIKKCFESQYVCARTKS